MDKKTDPAAAHLEQLINSAVPPDLPAELADDPLMQHLHAQMLRIRDILSAFATGDMSPDIDVRGFLAGRLKSLQANLRNLTWQVQQVEQEDYSQRVEFMGEFSVAFNNMVIKLDSTVTALRKNEEELTRLNKSLQAEINLRNSAMQALQESETRFKYLAGHDPLTGVLNRRAFMDQSMKALLASYAASKPCGFILLDVDSFKKFNDTYGHTAGDSALQHVVHTAQSVLRTSDLMGRHGGEEFVFCLGDTNLQQAEATAERIRHALETTPLELGKESVTLTASLGATIAQPEFEPNDELLNFVLNTADKNMYTAKNAGKNRVVSSEPGIQPKRRRGDKVLQFRS